MVQSSRKEARAASCDASRCKLRKTCVRFLRRKLRMTLLLRCLAIEHALATVAVSWARRFVATHTRRKSGAHGVLTRQSALSLGSQVAVQDVTPRKVCEAPNISYCHAEWRALVGQSPAKSAAKVVVASKRMSNRSHFSRKSTCQEEKRKFIAHTAPFVAAAPVMRQRARACATQVRWLAHAVRAAWNTRSHYHPMVTTSWEMWQILRTRRAYCSRAKERARLNASFFAW